MRWRIALLSLRQWGKEALPPLPCKGKIGLPVLPPRGQGRAPCRIDADPHTQIGAAPSASPSGG